MATTDIDDYLNTLLLKKLAGKQNFWSFYDSEADTLYFNFKKPSVATDSEITDDDVIIRYEGDQVIGFTVLHASKRGSNPSLPIAYARQIKLLEEYLLLQQNLKRLPIFVWWHVSGNRWVSWFGFPIFRPLLALLVNGHVKRSLIPLEKAYKLKASASPSEAESVQWMSLWQRVKLMREETNAIVVSPWVLAILGLCTNVAIALVLPISQEAWDTIMNINYIFYVINITSVALGVLSLATVVHFYAKGRLFNEPYVKPSELFSAPVLKKSTNLAGAKSLYLEEKKLFETIDEPLPYESPIDQLLLAATYFYLSSVAAIGFGVLASDVYSRNQNTAYLLVFLSGIAVLAGCLLIREVLLEIKKRRTTQSGS
ncbi:MAG: DUF2283 domain-containing protein [Aphanocapsa lilacina HA4352-LM1]|jgi:uncharacterized protein YuzE|nr:DUF2283 domain-containing protein [Aphanocapsa lilacina HA4352-LM1]